MTLANNQLAINRISLIMDQYTISTLPMRKNPIKSAPVHADYYIHPLIPRIYYGLHYD